MCIGSLDHRNKLLLKGFVKLPSSFELLLYLLKLFMIDPGGKGIG